MLRSSVLGSVLVVSFAVACGGSGDENVAKVPQSLIDGCERDFACVVTRDDPTGVGTTFNARGQKRADGCTVDTMIAAPDGTVSRTLHPELIERGSWSGNADAFDLCVTINMDYNDMRIDWCEHCVAAAPPPSPTGGGHCTGTPDLCSSQSPGWCSDLRGCRMSSEAHYDGTFTDRCTGTANSCDEFDTEASCKKQGCKWQ